MDEFEKTMREKAPLDYAWEFGETRRIYRNPATPYIILKVPNREWTAEANHPRASVFQVGIEIDETIDGETFRVFKWVATCLQVAMAIKIVKELQAIDDDMGCDHGPCAWSFP